MKASKRFRKSRVIRLVCSLCEGAETVSILRYSGTKTDPQYDPKKDVSTICASCLEKMHDNAVGGREFRRDLRTVEQVMLQGR